MKSKTILTTGSTSGIGRAAALLLAEAGQKIIIVGRNKQSAQATVSEIRSKTGNNNVHVLIADLSSPSSVRRLAREFQKNYQNLDILINCAAVFMDKKVLTSDGFELMFATNYLAPFLLTNLLLDSLRKSPAPRIINVTANSPLKPDFDNLQGEKNFNPMMAFGTTKAENLLFTYELARRLKNSTFTVNAYHPGVTRGTNLMSHAPFYLRWVMNLATPFLLTPRQAARGLVDLALSDKYRKSTGQLIYKGKPMKMALEDDLDIQSRLWEVSEKLSD